LLFLPIFCPPEKKYLFYLFLCIIKPRSLYGNSGEVLNESDFSCPHPWIATKHINKSIAGFFYVSRKKSVLDQLFEMLFGVLDILKKLGGLSGGLAFEEPIDDFFYTGIIQFTPIVKA
jgi:hypothetical protein